MLLPKEELLLCRRSCFRRCAPRRQMPAALRRIPRIMPGKNPASTAPVGNFLQEAAAIGMEVFCDGIFELVGVIIDMELALVPVLVGFDVGVEEDTEEVAGAID